MSPLPIEELRQAEREAKKAWEDAVKEANDKVTSAHAVWLRASLTLLDAERRAKANKSTK